MRPFWVGDEGNAVGACPGGRKAVIYIRNAQVLEGGSFSFCQGDEGPGHNAVGETAVKKNHHVNGSQGSKPVQDLLL